MTMPHLMNCDHSDTGWCLDCVKRMHDQFTSEATDTAIKRDEGVALLRDAIEGGIAAMATATLPIWLDDVRWFLVEEWSGLRKLTEDALENCTKCTHKRESHNHIADVSKKAASD